MSFVFVALGGELESEKSRAYESADQNARSR